MSAKVRMERAIPTRDYVVMPFSNVMNVTMNLKEKRAKWIKNVWMTIMSTYALSVILNVSHNVKE
jgi:hypothetical protein